MVNIISKKCLAFFELLIIVIFIEEFGHNWGSEHDPLKPECTPSSSNGGNFIMYAYSNQGHEKNNYVINLYY
jgi:hypothetical protein